MAQQQLRHKLVEKTIQQPSAVQSTSVDHDQIVSEQQSFAMVQTTLQTSVAILAFLRNLLPEHCYDWLDYKTICGKACPSHRSGVEGEISESQSPGGQSRASRRAGFRAITRGRATSGDQLLDWLDVILDGIQRQTVATVQFSIYSDQANPLNVIESYRFSFQYAQIPGGANHQVVGMALSGSNGMSVTVISAMSRLERIHDCLYNWSNFAPDLPDVRFLMCHLLHTPTCPSDFRPVGFQQCSDTTMFVPDRDLWHIKERNMGEMGSGFHSVSLDVGYLVVKEGAELDSDGLLEIPQRLEHTRAVPRFSNVTRNPGVAAAEAATAATPGNHTVETCAELSYDSPLSHNTVLSKDTVDLDKNVAELTKAQETIGSGIPEDNALTKSPSQWLDDSQGDLILTQKLHPCSQRSEAVQGMRLVRWKWLEMIAKREALKAGRQEDSAMPDHPTVRCECGFGREEAGMIQCDCCDTWQHSHCYGFMSKMPNDEHFCYRCLFANSDVRRLQDLERLAQTRRAIWIAYREEYPGNLRRFAKMLHYNKASETEVIRRMKDEGYLVRGKGSQFYRVDSTEQVQKRDRDYANPITLLGHLYEVADEVRPRKRVKST